MHAAEAAVELVDEGVERLDGVLDEEPGAAPGSNERDQLALDDV